MWQHVCLQVRAVGVCNYNSDQVTQMHELLKAHSIPLASNQVQLVWQSIPSIHRLIGCSLLAISYGMQLCFAANYSHHRWYVFLGRM